MTKRHPIQYTNPMQKQAFLLSSRARKLYAKMNREGLENEESDEKEERGVFRNATVWRYRIAGSLL